jgi:glycosyltransferase involved in cell wall biosynthesis/SAM-dependent methyltransferase
MSRLRILTFNFHEPYLCLMAKTGLDFTVGLYSKPPLARQWQTHFRPIPPNMKLVEEKTWRALLEADRFDVVVAQNETNAIDLFKYDTPKLLLCHNRRTFLRETVSGDVQDACAIFDRLLKRLQERFGFLFISESKRADYGIPGDVILPGIDIDDFGGYTGETPEVLRVGNLMRDRNQMFDVDFQEQACAGVLNRVIGLDPQIPGAAPAASFENLLHFFRTLRCLLHVTREEYEDGYNLSMLEAMACGMPVVSLANATSPLTHGEDSLISRDADELRGYLRELLDNPDLARKLGKRARETVAEKFPISKFVENWRNILERAAETAPRQIRHKNKKIGTGRNILLHYVASPLTTARYIEEALRKTHNVITAGFRCPEAVLQNWNFTMPAPPYSTHDIDLPFRYTYHDILSKTPTGFKPDLYIWADSGEKEIPEDIDAIPCPKACYLIDTHIAPQPRLALARKFDCTFMAQKAQVQAFRDAEVTNVHWLPLGCSPKLHNLPPMERIYDVAYIGGLDGDATDRRRVLLRKIGERFPNSRIERRWPHEMAEIYAKSKIVVNVCVNRDVNMRVFEGMASGALLITDEADGLEDLFENGKHLVIYRKDEDVFDLISYYLAHAEEREAISSAGKTEVLENHTYTQRMQKILTEVAQNQTTLCGYRGEARFHEGGYYRNTRPEVAQFVPLAAQRLLDVGCGGGDFGHALKQHGMKEVHGIELVERAWKEAQKVLDQAHLGNIEQMELPYEDGYFDCITFSDVLEHLRNPIDALRKASRVLAQDGVILMSIPNVRFHQVVTMLLNGRWKYEDAGILDRTHLRFFTAAEILEMVRESGLIPLHIQPLSNGSSDSLPRAEDGSVKLGETIYHPHDDEDYQDLLTYQYIAIAGKPRADRLTKARDALRRRNNKAALTFAEEARGVDEAERAKLIAIASARMGQLTLAESQYHKSLSLNPDDPETMGELGILLLGMNRASEAKPLLEAARDSKNANERVLGALGLSYIAEGRDEEGFVCIKESMNESFEGTMLVPHLVNVAARINRLNEIGDIMKRYADFYAGNPELARCYIDYLVITGQRDEARSRLETYLLLNQEDAEARERLTAIERGEQ